MTFVGFLVPTWPPKSMENRLKLGQVGPKLGQLASRLDQVGVSNASLDVQLHKMCFPCALGAQHGSKSLPEWGPGGARAPVFRSCFILEGLLAPRGPKRGPRGPQRAPRLNFEKILDGFSDGSGRILETCWDGFGKIF